jgi:rhamnosyltransferase
MKNVFIIGSKGIPSRYGGFETFVDKLTENKATDSIKYHVACLSDNYDEHEYNNARCFNVKIPNIGPAKAIFYDVKSLDLVYRYIKMNHVKNAIVYILACRIGPFMRYYKKKFNKLGIPIYVNPDGHEWKRAKWNRIVRNYWKFSERLMIKNTDLAICDSKAIQKYINDEYSSYNPNTTFIAYGATVNISNPFELADYKEWLEKWDLEKSEYYLIVGRFVPENNYEIMIKEFLKSKTTKALVIVTNIKENKFYNELKKSTNFDADNRIKFVGTVYDQQLLYQIRENAFAYLHGHEVGGTNPSLLEALATTQINILLDVQFNREVGINAALYFNKEPNSLAETIKAADLLSEEEIKIMENLAKERIQKEYSWDIIVAEYERLFQKN